jgi:hypothetical protein
MRSKIGYGVIGITVAFLLATNPVVVNAAGQIGSAQIKNNSIKSKDIKNNQVKSVDVKDGSLTAADLAAGTIPVEIKAVRRLSFEGTLTLVNGTQTFVESAPVTVDGNDIVVVESVTHVNGDAAGNDIDMGTCIRPVGAVTPPAFLDTVDFFDIDTYTADSQLYPLSGSGTPAAGSYDVGPCMNGFSGNNDVLDVSGTVMVIDGASAGALGKPSQGSTGTRD